MADRKKTPEAARAAQASIWQMYYLVRTNKIPAPPKDSSGDYIWGARDVEAARRALRARQSRQIQELKSETATATVTPISK